MVVRLSKRKEREMSQYFKIDWKGDYTLESSTFIKPIAQVG